MTPVLAASLVLTYHPTQDRLFLTVTGKKDAAIVLILTRRIVRNLLRTIAEILLKANDRVKKAPAGLSVDVMGFEHESAIASPGIGASKGGEAGGGPPAAAPEAPVVTEIVIAAKGKSFTLHVKVGQDVVAQVPAMEADLHRILATIDGAGREAQWNIEAETGWLFESRKAEREPLRKS